MNSLTSGYPNINPDNIDARQFTLSLMNEGLKANIFTASEITQKQTQILTILKRYILKYTHNDSSSVSEETAQSILNSIFYCLDSYLMSFNNLGQCIDNFRHNNLKEIHCKGLELTKTYIFQAQSLLQEVKNTKLDLSLAAYDTTINEGIDEFFQNYDANFDAHNVPANIDYPLLFDHISLTGVNYIKNYLEKLNLENQFCQNFSLSDINQLLTNYGIKYGFDYKEMLINISELVLQNALFSVLLGRSATQLAISLEKCNLLGINLQKLTNEQCFRKIQQALEDIIEELHITNGALKEYLQIFLNKFFPTLYNTIQQNNLSSLLVICQNIDQPPALLYESGIMLSDEKLREIIEELLQCKNSPAKLSLIMSEIHSLEDLIEILGADCLFDNEYDDVFDLLGDYEMAVLIAKFFDNIPFASNRSMIVDEFHRPENETQWLKLFISHLAKFDGDRQKSIIQISNILESDSI